MRSSYLLVKHSQDGNYSVLDVYTDKRNAELGREQYICDYIRDRDGFDRIGEDGLKICKNLSNCAAGHYVLHNWNVVNRITIEKRRHLSNYFKYQNVNLFSVNIVEMPVKLFTKLFRSYKNSVEIPQEPNFGDLWSVFTSEFVVTKTFKYLQNTENPKVSDIKKEFSEEIIYNFDFPITTRVELGESIIAELAEDKLIQKKKLKKTHGKYI
jgi:hypothetical protein